MNIKMEIKWLCYVSRVYSANNMSSEEIYTNRNNSSTNKTVWYNLMLRMIITMSVNNLKMSYKLT